MIRPASFNDRMIPADWTPYRRLDDGELVGYLKPSGTDDAVVPVTLFGFPLDQPGDEAAGEAVLERIGLSYLADPWWLRLDHGQTIEVRIAEARPDQLIVSNADFGYGTIGDRFVLEVPEPGRLTRSP